MQFEGYFDESGDLESQPRIFCISGYYFTKPNAAEMKLRWEKALSDYKLPYFHMVDCAHGKGVFKPLSKDDRDRLQRQLIRLIKHYAGPGFSYVFYANRFTPSVQSPDPYTLGVSSAVTEFESFIERNNIDSNSIAYFFESGHKNKGNAYNRVAARIKDAGSSLTFANKEDKPLLQAADLLAWHTTKYVKDRLGEKRKPRKDFLSLMEHRHLFAHHSENEFGERGVGLEEFPFRSGGRSVRLTIEDSGPIAFVREGDKPTPIIPITRVLGWRPGAAEGTCVIFFKQMDWEREFAISLDSRQLTAAYGGAGERHSSFSKRKNRRRLRPQRHTGSDGRRRNLTHIDPADRWKVRNPTDPWSGEGVTQAAAERFT